jgi:transcriptional regulator with XRE-family HTH domain
MDNDTTDDNAESRRVLGLAVRELRQRAGLLQRELAANMGTVDTYISHLEHGRVDIKWSTLRRLLDTLDASVSNFASAIQKAEHED